MTDRKEFYITEQQYDKLLDACKPVPAMYLSGGTLMGPSPQENANRAWCELGKEMGFDGMTVKPSSKGKLFFTAIPVAA